jgi:hypothetical protein
MNRGSTLALAAGVALAVLVPGRAPAFEFFDGRLQAHGFYEMQLRTISEDFDVDEFDLTQWYNIFDLELELDIAPDGAGPFDLVSAFVRAEVRYDCVWTRGCGMIHGRRVYGDDAREVPKRLSGARRTGFDGATFTGDRRETQGVQFPGLPGSEAANDPNFLGFASKDQPIGDPRRLAFLWHFPGVSTLFGVPGTDTVAGTDDDPAFFVFSRFVQPGDEYRFGLRDIRGSINGHDLQALGPWRPENRIDPLGSLADRPNPFNSDDFFDPAKNGSGNFGSTELPFRPAPDVAVWDENGPIPFDGDPTTPRGLFIPNEAVARLMREGALDSFDQNFSENELAWNRGASQQDEAELKEAYLDLELFDSRLWVRIGKQNIVWGKTELFRTTDQFNPQDLALASLPSLEESRVALWSGRFVWSFYEVGPLSDVRAEFALNYDDFEPVDLGRCGEPYTPDPVCSKSAGLFAHGLAGFGLAGERRPPDPWHGTPGIEFGGRVEFRWDRFSFALSDFWGYDDFPYVDQVFLYERNVDPATGLPRRAGARGDCMTGDEPACLQSGSDPSDPDAALFAHHANQQRFAVICASSVGFNDLDRSVCAQSVLNSGVVQAGFYITELLGSVVAGDPSSNLKLTVAGDPNLPTVTLNLDPDSTPSAFVRLGDVLTDEQQALLGCGPFWQTSCDTHEFRRRKQNITKFGGIDLLNAEMSALIQSWPGFPGTSRDVRPVWETTDSSVAQPGTIGFVGGAVATRFEEGRTFVLPGARSPFASEMDLAPGEWMASVDGCPADLAGTDCEGAEDLVHPFANDAITGLPQQFRSELAAFSWNLLVTLVAISTAPAGEEPAIDEFDPTDAMGIQREAERAAMGLDPNVCSYRKPQFCSSVQAIYAVSHTTRRIVRAGGNGTYGRTDFDWHVAGSGVLRYQKRNVLGFSMDVAEDRTKTNWSFEATWFNDVLREDHDSPTGLKEVDTYNLTVSVDRPTFINFLNQHRTFFINSQWFFQYVDGYESSFPSNGPFNVLATVTIDSGYFQDRLNPSVTFVYDFPSHSGAAITQVSYRYTESFSASIGALLFWGRSESVVPPLTTVGDPPFRVGEDRDRVFVDNGLSAIRDRDELFLRLRYTF